MNKYFSEVIQFSEYQMKRQAKKTRASIHGKITTVHSGKRYDVTTADGKVYRKVGCAIPTDSFSLNTWVIMEFTTTDWQIVGFSGQAASNDV